MDKMREAVAEFHQKFQASDDPELWKRLIREEKEELKEAFRQFLKEAADMIYVGLGLEIVAGEEECGKYMEEVLDDLPAGLQDAITAAEYLVDETFFMTHDSNMSKLDDNGEPIFREDGKVMKGPNYKPPDLTALV